MAKSAKVTSVEMMQKFHSEMAVYQTESLAALDKIRCEIARRDHMLHYELPAKWRAELLQWQEKLKAAQKEIRYSTTSVARIEAEQMQRLAKKKIHNAEQKLANLKKWHQRFPLDIAELQTRLLSLKTFLVNDFDKSRHSLKQQIETLIQYTQINKGI